mmetsp:Transcript_29448/g.99196  ORF Transcript_29448/g.99196 Transcript_29448/m.99196 type:complete len:289 (-) Transcript_29448:796-1662(-)
MPACRSARPRLKRSSSAPARSAMAQSVARENEDAISAPPVSAAVSDDDAARDVRTMASAAAAYASGPVAGRGTAADASRDARTRATSTSKFEYSSQTDRPRAPVGASAAGAPWSIRSEAAKRPGFSPGFSPAQTTPAAIRRSSSCMSARSRSRPSASAASGRRVATKSCQSDCSFWSARSDLAQCRASCVSRSAAATRRACAPRVRKSCDASTTAERTMVATARRVRPRCRALPRPSASRHLRPDEDRSSSSSKGPRSLAASLFGRGAFFAEETLAPSESVAAQRGDR